ncbi:cyclin-J [Onthophagus taurus]|uniref:cyclin-J n=1 Tax=Onthophagus taurus TaxID=166361 RepID=UPI000C2045BF|nr:cyclin-J [Onthophagus taurus]
MMNISESNLDSIIDYLDDYKYTIKERDNLKLDFTHESSQLNYRSFMINHLKSYASLKSIVPSTLQLAVYLVDMVMDSYKLQEEKFLLIANVCLLIAAKVDEYSGNVPKLTELNASVANIYEISDYKRMEMFILNIFNGFVNFPTPAHCSHYYFQAILDNEDVKIIKERKETINETKRVLNSLLLTSLDRYINDIHYMQFYPPSLLAAAAISACRVQYGLANWNRQLENFTGYTETVLEEIKKFLLQPHSLKCTLCPNE